MPVGLIFIDGVGIGKDEPAENPFSVYRSRFFKLYTDSGENLADFDGIIIPTDASLGVSGLPQSATGQTAIFTGVNAPKVMNAHINGFPTPTLRKIILRESIFLKLKLIGKSATFANAYSKQYFELRKSRLSASTYAVMAGGFPFRWYDRELEEGKAIPADLTGDFMRKLNLNVKKLTPETSGEIFSRLLEEYDFVMFEFPFTDMAGHRRSFDEAIEYIDRLERFLNSLLSNTDLKKSTVILTSDHGNVENLRIKTHTENKVPTIVWGRGKEILVSKIKDLTDLTPAILNLF